LCAANGEVRKEARSTRELRGMGTTCVAALIRDRMAAIGNVGDSRAYLLRDGKMRQVTEDHSLVQEHIRSGDLSEEEAQVSRYRNVITRAIGISDDVEPDVDIVNLQDGDLLLICTDGLTNMVREAQIARVLIEEPDPQSACERLVKTANANGGVDNITTIVIQNGEHASGTQPVIEENYHRPPLLISQPASNSAPLVISLLLIIGL